MHADVPTTADDPRLKGWYHTIDLGPGLASHGFFDHRSVVDRYGLPTSLAGLTALDIGTADGFWAFEMERRGADRVVASDIATYGDFDWLPHIRDGLGAQLDTPRRGYFDLAHRMRGSRVEYRVCSVYDLSPTSVGEFDVVFCGSLLLHLQNPVKALSAIRSVTRGMAIIETLVDPYLERHSKGRPWMSFGHREAETAEGKQLGEACVYWSFSTAALKEMLTYAGFTTIESRKPFALPPGQLPVTAVVARAG
jgi:tRNA (mo5U34)-methyltransferase